jgi:alpha-amylase
MLKYASSKEQDISDSKIVKILSRVQHDKGFHFFTDLGKNTGETATSLETFAQKLEKIDPDSVKFHFQRKDFQNWIQTTVGDGVLAERINHVSGQRPVEDLRSELVKTVQERISQLRLLHGELIPSQ